LPWTLFSLWLRVRVSNLSFSEFVVSSELNLVWGQQKAIDIRLLRCLVVSVGFEVGVVAE
jgi:hypothetical protein